MKVKQIALLMTALVGMIMFSISSCSTTQTTANPEAQKQDEPAFRELADILRTEPGLSIKGNSPNYSITIRGRQTFNSPTQPLFVVDGIAVGTSYAQVANMVNITDIADVKVLKGSEATSWGSRGANGVIEIRLKRGLN